MDDPRSNPEAEVSGSNPKRRRQLRPDQRLCPHCNQIVSYKTFRMHKRLYFNVEKRRWFCGDARSSSEPVTSEVDGVDEESVCESNPGEGTFESDGIESSSPPRDEPQSLESSDESCPLSEPACMSTSVSDWSCPTTDGQ